MSIEVTDNTWDVLKLEGFLTSEYPKYIKLCKKRKKLAPSLDFKHRKKIKLAVLGTANTDFIPEPLEFALSSLGIECEILTTPFNTYAFEMFDGNSVVSKFKPDVVVFISTSFTQPEWPNLKTDSDENKLMVERTVDYWLNLCASVHKSTGCEIIFDNFFQLPWRPNGNLSTRLNSDHNSYLANINMAMGNNAPSYVHISDVAWMSSYYGISNWIDLKYWYHAKLPVSFKCFVSYIKNTSGLIASLYGGTKKVLVLDLDNTLWGGTIGDDGINGIKIGQGTPAGEAFLSFQKYIHQLKERGVLLAVCSKNEEVNAKLPFESHPEMHLKLDDFTCFIANWDPKSDNLIDMASKLNLGIDSFVFVDDNPAERELMRMQLPEVLTIELDDEPSNYPQLIDAQSPFELTSFSEEDMSRSHQYKENFKRESLKATATSYNDYLASLEQHAFINKFEMSRLERITQLINKTNQFNLTTARLTNADVESLMLSDSNMTAYVSLKDKFGDNGVISVIYGRWETENLAIDGWLMSCRVFKRSVENIICDYIVELARTKGKKLIIGKFIPTEKNNIVKNLYAELGFELINTHIDGATTWSIDVDSYTLSNKPITVEVQ